jgi:site-specific DNA recombinase
MSLIQAALYARVSSEPPAKAQTIARQITALHERVTADGLAVPPAMQFLDEGLERLRDAVATGAMDRLYSHAPDRLARKYAYQVLLVEEFRRCGVEGVFLNRA